MPSGGSTKPGDGEEEFVHHIAIEVSDLSGMLKGDRLMAHHAHVLSSPSAVSTLEYRQSK